MSPSSVLRFPISGREDEFFLLEVTSAGSKPLDLKLLGSEGDEIYLTKLRHRRVVEHKTSTTHCTEQEWESIVTAVLLEHKPVHDIEVKADIQTDGDSVSAISLSFRKKIQGISQRLGAISLPLLPDEERDDANQISPFHLCVQVLGERAELQNEAANSSAKIRFLEEAVQELKDQLSDLIRAKESDETILLEKFRDLLNEKKVKIRQQQRLLASVDPGARPVDNDDEELDDVKPSTTAPRRSVKPSRPAKRRLESTTSNINADNDLDSSGSPDAMDVDDDNSAGIQPPIDPEAEDRMTTDEDETADEAEDSDAASAPPVSKSKPTRAAAARTNSKSKAAAKATPARATRRNNNDGKAAPSEVKSEPASQATSTDDVPPAKRELPFMRNKKKVAAPPPSKAAAPAEDDDETGSDDDDEL